MFNLQRKRSIRPYQPTLIKF